MSVRVEIPADRPLLSAVPVDVSISFCISLEKEIRSTRIMPALFCVRSRCAIMQQGNPI